MSEAGPVRRPFRAAWAFPALFLSTIQGCYSDNVVAARLEADTAPVAESGTVGGGAPSDDRGGLRDRVIVTD